MHGAPPGHVVPQVPQLRLFVSRLTHTPLQSVSPAAVLQVPVQTPAVQSVPPGQRSPQPPQLRGLVCVSVHESPQSVSAPHVQAPATQSAPVGQGELHAPQLFASFWRLTHAPEHSVSAGPESDVHVVVQTPPAHNVPVPPSEPHTLPHAPQLSGSLCVAVHTPLQRWPPFAHWHEPLWQDVPPEQRTLQPPQLSLSVCSFTQSVPQRSRPEAQMH